MVVRLNFGNSQISAAHFHISACSTYSSALGETFVIKTMSLLT